MSQFLTPLTAHQIAPRVWRLDAEFKYQSDILGLITVPKDFLTDFESCPVWIPIINSIFGNIADYPALVHDWLFYSAICGDRKTGDLVCLEAMGLIPGLSAWRKKGIYYGLRLGSWQAWNAHRKAGHNAFSLKPSVEVMPWGNWIASSEKL